MKRRKRNFYLTNDQLAEELIASQNIGQPTEKLCMYFRMIATHMLGSPKFRHYEHHLQEDMASAALIKCLKNVHNYKEEYRYNCFNYYSRCTEHAFFEVLGKHYKTVNLDRDLKLMYADAIEGLNQQAARKIRNYNKED